MSDLNPGRKVIIVGAGMAGLTAARELTRNGVEVLILDKARGVGGRIATRRIGEGTLDHGAQFITTRHPRFAEVIEECRQGGVAEVWCRGFTNPGDGHPRWRGQPGMTAIAKHLARGLELQMEAQVAAIRREGDHWRLLSATATHWDADAVILTAPLPQSLALLAAGNVTLEVADQQALAAVRYEKCLTVLALLESPSKIAAPGGVHVKGGPVAWIADNQLKGISKVPAVTLQAPPRFSDEWFERDRLEAGRRMIASVTEHLGSPVVEFMTHGWRYSHPVAHVDRLCLVTHRQPPLILAGDAFGGPRVEGAALSGWSAAEALLDLGLVIR